MKPELKIASEVWRQFMASALTATITNNPCLQAKSVIRRAASAADQAYREWRLRFDLESTFDPAPHKTEDRDEDAG